jgi:hypothetical protein
MLDQIYARRVLDCVVEAAVAVSSDYYSRPNQYGGVSDHVAGILRQLKSKTGTDPDFPDFVQRQRMFAALVGVSDTDDSSVAQAARDVRCEACNYAMSGVLHGRVDKAPVLSPGEPALRRAFEDSLSTYRGVLSVVNDTAALKTAFAQTDNIFRVSVEVLQHEPVARAFGVAAAPKENWPLSGRQDGKGALLMQEISKPLSNETLRFMPMICFLWAQRIAAYGAETIVAAFASDSYRDPEAIPRAIVSAYAWHTAIEEYGRLYMANMLNLRIRARSVEPYFHENDPLIALLIADAKSKRRIVGRVDYKAWNQQLSKETKPQCGSPLLLVR